MTVGAPDGIVVGNAVIGGAIIAGGVLHTIIAGIRTGTGRIIGLVRITIAGGMAPTTVAGIARTTTGITVEAAFT
jgi:hypothetical protein